MNSPMSAHHQSLQDRYHQLRRQLTDLSYPETFGIDAVDLVDHLLRDLLSTTSSYKQLQDKENRLSSDLALVQAQLFPLRRENARLTRENHELHIDHIRQNEESNMQIDNYSRQVREANDKMQELKMLTSVYEAQLKNKDEIIERLREAYEGVVDPALKAKHSTTSSIKSSGKLSKADKSEQGSTGRSFISGNNSVAGGMSVSGASRVSVKSRASARNDLINHPIVESQQEKVISALRGQLESATQKLQTAEDEVKHLKSAISAREQELSRSNRIIGNAAARSILSGDNSSSGASLQPMMGSPIDPQIIDSSNKRIIDQLNSQVDFLNEQLAFREAQLTTLQGQIHESENLKTELEVSVTTLERFKEENQRMSNRMHLLEQKLMSMGASLNTPRKTPTAHSASEHHYHDASMPSIETKDISGSPQRYGKGGDGHNDNHNNTAMYEDVIKKLKLEKSQLEKELQVAQSKAQAAVPSTAPSKTSTKPTTGKASSASRDTALIAELNQEVETLRKKTTMLQKQVKEYEAKISYLQSLVPANTTNSNPSNNVANQTREELRVVRDQLESKEELVQELTYQRDKLQTLFDSCNDTLQVLQEEHRQLQEEHFHLTESFQSLQATHQQVQQSLQQTQQEVQVRLQESQQLQQSNHVLQLQLVELQQQVVDSVPRPPLTSASASSASSAAAPAAAVPAAVTSNNAIIIKAHEDRIRQLQQENQQLQVKITQLQSDVTLAQHRMATSQSAISDEQHRLVALEDLITTYKQQLETLQYEKQSLHQEVLTYLQAKEQLEHKQDLLHHQLEEERSKRKTTEVQTIALQKQMEEMKFQYQQLQDVFSRYEVNYQHLQDKNIHYEHVVEKFTIEKQGWQEDKTVLEKMLQEKETQLQQVKQVMKEIDAQRDQLQDSFDALEESYRIKAMEVTRSQEQHHALQIMITSQEQQLQSKQQEITQLLKVSQELDGKVNVLTLEKQELQRKCQEKIRKEGNMNDDLMVMTKENQALSSELSRLCHERDGLITQLREYVTQLQFMESNKHSLEIEKSDLLENYRVVIKEKRKLEDELRSVSSNQAEKTASFKQMERELMELQAKLQSYQHLEERWAIEKSALTNHIEMLNDSVIDIQRKMEAMESDNRKMIQETHAMKQTNALLNERLSIVMKRAAASNEANKVLTTRLSSVERERDAVRAIVEVERQRAQDMMKVAEVARIDAATKDLHIQRLRTELHEESADSLSSPNVSSVKESSSPPPPSYNV